MKVSALVLSLLLLLLVLPCAARSDDESELKEKKEETAAVPKEVAACQKKLAKLDLSDEQQEALKQLVVTASEAYADGDKELKEEIIKDFKYQVSEYVLTQEQRDKLGLTPKEEKPPVPKQVAALTKKLKQAGLSEEQQRQLERIVTETSSAFAEADDDEAKKLALHDFRYRVVTYVLTEAQLDKLGLKPPKKKSVTPRLVAVVRKQLSALDLSDEQEEKIKSLLEEASAALAEAESGPDRRRILQTLRKNVWVYVLTEEQKEKLKQQLDAKKKEALKKKETKKEADKKDATKKKPKEIPSPTKAGKKTKTDE